MGQGRLAKAIDVDYSEDQGDIACPVSEQYGLSATAGSGYRCCFQRSTGVTPSIIYSLIWEGGEWKADASVTAPFILAALPAASGYITWRRDVIISLI
ncbi:hypothetical protein [Actinomyces sp. 432]|uniref:hypothetical protein n=1 Tax=Actinomyces sp. 432 TaxID=2057798 RepID=UPI00137B0CCC|nr:hypothetical protein [Actinomyces sp. 432]